MTPEAKSLFSYGFPMVFLWCSHFPAKFRWFSAFPSDLRPAPLFQRSGCRGRGSREDHAQHHQGQATGEENGTTSICKVLWRVDAGCRWWFFGGFWTGVSWWFYGFYGIWMVIFSDFDEHFMGFMGYEWWFCRIFMVMLWDVMGCHGDLNRDWSNKKWEWLSLYHL